MTPYDRVKIQLHSLMKQLLMALSFYCCACSCVSLVHLFVLCRVSHPHNQGYVRRCAAHATSHSACSACCAMSYTSKYCFLNASVVVFFYSFLILTFVLTQNNELPRCFVSSPSIVQFVFTLVVLFVGFYQVMQSLGFVYM